MWTNEISSIVFTRIKTEASKRLKSKYPDIYFTNSDRAQTDPKFPTVYIHEIGSAEQGEDLQGTEINAVMTTFQIDVTDNQSQNRTNEVMSYVVEMMKSMRFSVIAMPEFQNTESTYRSTARFRRLIGNGDIL